MTATAPQVPMPRRRLGKTGFDVGVIGFGAWPIGGSWGDVADSEAMAALHAAADSGVTFFDTADVYGDGRSERLIGRLLAEREERLVVATKMGRRSPLDPANYTMENFRSWTDRSRRLLGVDRLDLTQLHCLGDGIYRRPDIWEALDTLRQEGLIANYGVSVETVDEAMQALSIPGIASVQIIFNLFRQKPAEDFFPAAAAADVGVIARVPLASGLLTGKLSADSSFPSSDHRNFNRHGEAFDVGETFAGVPYELGLAAVEKIRVAAPDLPLTGVALRWILMFDQVSTVIPGARNAAQAINNASMASLAPLHPGFMAEAREIYREMIAPVVHQRW
jgi:aryl-alcohol dehydrogenase-like predicted oxidoreductase